jgi:hypothetical protein
MRTAKAARSAWTWLFDAGRLRDLPHRVIDHLRGPFPLAVRAPVRDGVVVVARPDVLFVEADKPRVPQAAG